MRSMTAPKSAVDAAATRTPKLGAVAGVDRRSASGADERFGGHAADVEAIAAEEVPLDQRDLAPRPAAPAAVTRPAVPPPMTTRL